MQRSNAALVALLVALCCGLGAALRAPLAARPASAMAPVHAAPLRARAAVVCSMEGDDDSDDGMDSAPSDTGEDDDEPMMGSSPFGGADDELSIAKQSLLSELGDGLRATTPSAPSFGGSSQGSGRKLDRELIAELLLTLEKLNPTSAPAMSPLLNGKWKFVYAGGKTPGLAALRSLLNLAALVPKSPSGAPTVDIGDAVLTISRTQPRVEASLSTRVLSLENTLKLFASLETKTGSVMVEEYKELESSLVGFKLPFQSPASFKRSLVVTYLDDDLLVVRSLGGAPDVLVRSEKEWTGAAADDGWESVPVDEPSDL